jgi:SAM-dependent methyltransferase
MHPYIFNKFQELLAGREFSGPVLEVGAVPRDKTLLNLPALKNIKEKTGVNLDGPYSYNDFKIHKCDANDMGIFSDNSFGLVLCNAMLEHDRFFWKTIAEIKRVTRPGGLVLIGTPGYTESSFRKFKNKYRKYRWYRKICAIPFFDSILSSTTTFEIHGQGYGDYYRFSPAAFKEVFLSGFNKVEVFHFMKPPRIIGLGFKE